MKPPMIDTSMTTKSDLISGLRAIGVQAGQILVVHSSMKSIGWIPGGARTVVDALLEVLGPTGTLVMPSQTGDNSEPAYWVAPAVPRSWWPVIRSEMPAFDTRLSPLRHMGAIANSFFLYPGVLRSNHPLDSFIAYGPAAASLLAEHPLEGCLGPASPTQKLYDQDAKVLLIGVDYDRCTVMHLAEYHTRSRITFRQGSAITEQGQRVWKTFQDIALNSDEFILPGRLLDTTSHVQTGLIGLSPSRLFRVRQAVDQTAKWLKANRHHRLFPDEKQVVLAMLKRRPVENLFAIGDLEALSESDDFFDALVYYKPDEQDAFSGQVIDSVIIRYNTSVVLASETDTFALEPILETIDHPSINFISGRSSLMERIEPHRTDFTYRKSFLLQIDRDHLKDTGQTTAVIVGYPAAEMATVDDIPDLIGLFRQIEEFHTTAQRDDLADELKMAMERNLCHYVIQRYQGKIVAMAGTSAENSTSAMIVGVGTHPKHRGKGLASRLVAALCDRFLGNRFAKMALFYDNPEAGRIYRRLGFYDAGDWTMGTRKEPTV